MSDKIKLLTILAIWLISSSTSARFVVSDTSSNKKILPPVRKFYVGTELDGAIFSSATIKKNAPGAASAATNSMGILRFSCAADLGLTFNQNIGRHFAVYSGIAIKNVGFIEKNNGGETVKRRSYNLGVPIGVRIGNMVDKKPYLFLGGGADAPFNYKEKSYSIRDQKAKLSEWFSTRTPSMMPFVFAGFAIRHGFTFKLQYYLNNFLNPGFTADKMQPYTGYDVHLVLASLGYAVPIVKHQDIVAKEINDLHAQ